jgi:hypothetical protein
MKAKGIHTALECLKGSVLGEPGAVELSGQWARATDGSRWAKAMLPEPISPPITLPYSKFRQIAKNLGEDEELKIAPDGVKCRIEAPSTHWELNLLGIETESPPAFEPIEILETSGYELLDAYRPLKHLMCMELSEPGLLWAWSSEDNELVVGNGGALGGYRFSTGLKGFQIPIMGLMEIGRILAVHQSEKVTLTIGEKYLGVEMRDNFYFQSLLPATAKFKPEWYARFKEWLNDHSQEVKTSLSGLRHAIDLVGITAGESQFTMEPSNGALILSSKDEHGNQSASRVEATGNLQKPVTLDLKQVIPALDALSEEMIVLQASESKIVFRDKNYWEILKLLR